MGPFVPCLQTLTRLVQDQSTSRPMSGSLPRQPGSSRQHSHSISLAATNPTHRINRRKSVNSQASSTAAAAVAAALREHGDASALSFSAHRKSVGSRKTAESQSMNPRPDMDQYFSTEDTIHSIEIESDQIEDALDDTAVDDDMHPSKAINTKNRNRRASEGSHLTKGAKRVSSEVRCDTCGKGYKHSSCLTKHM